MFRCFKRKLYDSQNLSFLFLFCVYLTTFDEDTGESLFRQRLVFFCACRMRTWFFLLFSLMCLQQRSSGIDQTRPLSLSVSVSVSCLCVYMDGSRFPIPLAVTCLILRVRPTSRRLVSSKRESMTANITGRNCLIHPMYGRQSGGTFC